MYLIVWRKLVKIQSWDNILVCYGLFGVVKLRGLNHHAMTEMCMWVCYVIGVCYVKSVRANVLLIYVWVYMNFVYVCMLKYEPYVWAGDKMQVNIYIANSVWICMVNINVIFRRIGQVGHFFDVWFWAS